MAQSNTTPPPTRRMAPRPPRFNIKNLQPGAGPILGSMSPTAQPPTAPPPLTAQHPYTAQTAQTAFGGQPYWPPIANPFATGNFMAKGFEGFVDFTKSGMSFGEKFTYGLYNKFSKWSKKWFTHMFLFLVVTLYSVGGAVLFQAIEGKSEKQVQKEVLDILHKQADLHTLQRNFYNSMRELSKEIEGRNFTTTDFNGNVTNILRDHQTAVESLLNVNKTEAQIKQAQNPWSFWNSMVYCGTIYTTIGYGHITPKTKLGKSLTIIYAIIGIPLFLILLADFGKLFTRGMKFIWAYVRRLYYTGTCRQIRKQQQVRDAMSGINAVYDMAVRRPSHFFGIGPDTDVESQRTGDEGGTEKSIAASHPETPTSLYPETFEVDDEFNLPISIATTLLISYILVGAFVYTRWEAWTFFDSIYFVFVSMSTIGFGDIVPDHPIFMMLTIIYLIFGLALTSMFINVVQIKLSDTFKQASAKISATIGFNLASEMGDDAVSQLKTPAELASVHGSRLEKISENLSEQATSPPPVPTSILRNTHPASPAPQVSNQSEESEAPPPLPKRQDIVEPPPTETEKKKKKSRFF